MIGPLAVIIPIAAALVLVQLMASSHLHAELQRLWRPVRHHLYGADAATPQVAEHLEDDKEAKARMFAEKEKAMLNALIFPDGRPQIVNNED